jgi:methyl-accepting chemotaxis protein
MLRMGKESAGAAAVLKAISRSLATIEFDASGKILTANDNFCRTMDYALTEIQGRHHSLFVDPGYAASDDYRQFWEKLGRGEFDAREYKCIGKNGKEVWIQASYNPVRNGRGQVVRVVKVAIDVTQEKLRNAEFEAKIKAISRVQAVIEFTPAGAILDANENFLSAFGYQLEDIRGQHHRMLVEPAYASSPEYAQFWRTLNDGQYVAAEFKRLGKGGREVWIQASYNPIFDASNRVVKIVKFATDVTGRVAAVSEIGRGLAQLAVNNLEHRIDVSFDAAFEPLRQDFNRSLNSLQSAMARVAESASTIHAETQQISQSSDELSRRTEQQAASLEETAAALDEITATVTRTAEGARAANVAASEAKTEAESSSRVVSDAVAAMGEINDSSGKIGQIIGVIDEIAFQTNLLALNAGVEAARAGDAGKGFAVVAQEVRALAQRSAEAAREIKNLIASSSEQVKRGVRLVGDTGVALDGIARKVTEIDALIGEMARSAQEQAVGLSQVNTAVNQMDQVTQQNAAMVEEATATVVGLKKEADELASLMDRFRIGHGQAEAAPSAKLNLIGASRETRPANPVRRAQTKLATALKAGGPQAAAEWEEF